jgi:hypothetical protein
VITVKHHAVVLVARVHHDFGWWKEEEGVPESYERSPQNRVHWKITYRLIRSRTGV